MDRDTDRLVRLAAFTHLDDLQSRFGDVVPLVELRKGFTFRGETIRFLGPQGIFIPRGMSVPLSITTAPEQAGKERPYDDEIGDDGWLRYSYRGKTGADVGHRENLGLVAAMEGRMPLIYFWGIAPGAYRPTYPAFVAGADPSAMTFTVGFDSDLALDVDSVGSSDGEARRVYVTQEVLRRVHQARFRQQVLKAYRISCAICRLKHAQLLDAAHILPDGHAFGLPVVPNGLALCKIHHAAFDRNMIGVRPDSVVEVKSAILDESDGPMLRYGLQECNGQKLLVVPHRPIDRPSHDFLEERYELFRQAS